MSRAKPIWDTAVSLLAGLPRDRDAWLARVLPAIVASTSLRTLDRDLATPLGTAARWRLRLRVMIAAGDLHGVDLPALKIGHNPGRPTPRPTREQASAAGRAGAAARKAAPKTSKRPYRVEALTVDARGATVGVYTVHSTIGAARARASRCRRAGWETRITDLRTHAAVENA